MKLLHMPLYSVPQSLFLFRSDYWVSAIISCGIDCFQRFYSLSGVSPFENVLETLRLTKRGLAEILSSYEFIDQASMDCVETQLILKFPIGDFPFYVLIETSGTSLVLLKKRFNSLFVLCLRFKPGTRFSKTRTTIGNASEYWPCG